MTAPDLGRLSLLVKARSDMDDVRVPVRITRRADLSGNVVDEDHVDIRLGNDIRTIPLKPGHYQLEACWRDGSTSFHQAFVKEGVLCQRDLEPRSTFFGGHKDNDDTTLGQHHFEEIHDTWHLVDCDHANGTIEPLSEFLEVSELGTQFATVAARRWVIHEGPNGKILSSLPVNPGGDLAAAAFRLNAVAIPCLTLSDPDASVMADMLSGMNSDSALRYARATFSDMSHHDRMEMAKSRPLATCAFAYAEYESFEGAPWVDLLDVMGDHQRWISDVSVILGWRKLMSSRTEDDLVEAGQFLEHAVGIGVPYYSRGVKLLAEGLGLLGSMNDTLVTRSSIRRAYSAAAKTVPTETFTSIKL